MPLYHITELRHLVCFMQTYFNSIPRRGRRVILTGGAFAQGRFTPFFLSLFTAARIILAGIAGRFAVASNIVEQRGHFVVIVIYQLRQTTILKWVVLTINVSVE